MKALGEIVRAVLRLAVAAGEKKSLYRLFTNAGVSTNFYTYGLSQFPHYITEIDNGIGVPITKNYYDTSGRLIATVDANNNTNLFIHNLTNSLEVVVDPRGGTNTFVYDSRGNVTAKTNALKGITVSTYDINNNKTSETVYLNGSPYATSYSGYGLNTGLLLATTNALGFTNGFIYNSFGQLTTSFDALGNSSTSFYDPTTGNLTGTCDALSHTTANFYDNNGLLKGSTDTLGTLTTNFYDGSGNLTGTAVISTNGTILSTNSFGYDLDGNRTNSTVWRRVGGNWSNSVTAYVYDGQNRVVQTIDPDGGTNIVVFDLAGRQQKTINKLGWPTTYAYDWLNRLVLTTFPDGTTSSSTYDPNGNRITSVDQLGRTTIYAYDPLNRLTNTAFADLTTNVTVYDDLGRVKFTIDARGVTNAFGYDLAGGRVAVTNGLWTTVAMTNGFVFDGNANQTAFIDGAGYTTSYTFDALNRQTIITFPNTTNQIAIYDAASRRIAAVDQASITNWFTYDGVGRLTAVTNALGSAQYTWAQYQYDEAGNLTTQIDALNRTTSFAYDSMGRRIKRTLPGLQAETLGYDLVGNMIRDTNFDGQVITNQYDLLNRLTSRTSANGYSVSYGYSPTGQRTNMTDSTAITGYAYDDRDRLLTKTVNWSGGPINSLNYLYDPAGNLTTLYSSYTNGVTNYFQFDSLNRLTNVIASGSPAAGYAYDAAGNLQAISYRNGITNLYQYDSLNRLTNLAWMNGSSTKASFYYQLGAAGNRTNLTETLNGTARGYAWTYDSLYHLTQEAFSGGTIANISYGFDLVSNRTNRTSNLSGLTNQAFAYSPNDWLTNTDSYDSSGCTTASGTNFYSYDPLCHLTNANGIVFAYDGDGNRVQKTINGTNTFYLIDDRNPTGYAQALEEWTVTSSATNLSRVYNFGLAPISQMQGSTVYYLAQDGHGSTRLLFDSSGTVVNWFVFDAYGNLIASNTTPQTPLLYCGEYLDPDLQAYWQRARWLFQGTGRFGTLDSYAGNNEDPLSLHKYLYCHDDPLNRTDPTGHEDFISQLSATAIQVGLYTARWAVTHPKTTFVLLSALSATGIFDGFPPGEATPIDELQMWGKYLRGAPAAAKEVIVIAKYQNALFRQTFFSKFSQRSYDELFFKAFPELQGKVWVHHAVEQQALTLYPGVISEAEMNSLANLRGIPNELNPELHLRQIRKAWDQFYSTHLTATKQQLLDYAKQIDDAFGAQFNPPIR